MLIPRQFKCDECGALKSEDANHWYHASLNPGGVIVLMPWPAVESPDYPVHLCGRECALRFVSKALEVKPEA